MNPTMILENIHLSQASQLKDKVAELTDLRTLKVLSLTPRRFAVNEHIYWHVMPLTPVAYIDELASVLENRSPHQHLLIELPPPTKQWQPAHNLLQHFTEVTDA
ncbi:hypothetical protein HMF8227_03002 [Saliniradius amylolyticus]|uniref:Uncharacterized protein n=1 Tax=Saliniradius amylolyticus TaxID=2183582 RepID=A0A2S2E8B0_9ALTE|nr:hypothetical protein [Saliniradius amylolyticus]AWL13450.1 hypothetical protein HMF8227_03002 [Saliniradius amylolyticus]